MNASELMALRRAGLVRRYHTTPFAPVQTTGEHSYMMVVMLFALHPDPSVELIKAVTFHDSHELTLGDIPSPVKRISAIGDAYQRSEEAWNSSYGIPNLRDLDEEDRSWLTSLDALDGLLFCNDAQLFGRNDHLMEVGRNYAGYLRNDITVPTQVADFLKNHAGLELD